MKKLIPLFLAGVMACSIISCGNPRTSESDASYNTESHHTDNENSLEFWYNQQIWNTPKDSFVGGLFNEQISLPLDLRTIDVCSAPYNYRPQYVGQLSESIHVDSISEILSDEGTIKVTDSKYLTTSSTTITTQAETEASETNDQKPDNINNIHILNFDENGNDLPISTCYENGWWLIDIGEHYDHAAVLMLDYPKEGVTLLDAVTAKFGTPSYINLEMKTKEDFQNTLVANNGSLFYSLIYEYSEFTLCIYFNEMLMPEYNSEIHELYGVQYYPASCWKVAKELLELELVEPSSMTTSSNQAASSNQTTDASDSDWYFDKVTPTHQTTSAYPFSNFSGREDTLSQDEIWSPGEKVWELQNVATFTCTRKGEDKVSGTWDDVKNLEGHFYTLNVYSNTEYGGEQVKAAYFEFHYPDSIDTSGMTLEEALNQGYWSSSGLDDGDLHAGDLSADLTQRGTGVEQMDVIISIWGQPSEVYYTLETDEFTDVTYSNSFFIYDCGDHYVVFKLFQAGSTSELQAVSAYGTNASFAITSHLENVKQK